VLGINSCWAEQHGEDEEQHYGWVDRAALDRMLDDAAVTRQPLTIALVHHNPLLDATASTASLRQGRQLLDRLAENGVTLLLCGHGHKADAVGHTDLLAGRQIAVLAGGSTAVVARERPPDVRNQYQVIRLGDEPQVLRRCCSPAPPARARPPTCVTASVAGPPVRATPVSPSTCPSASWPPVLRQIANQRSEIEEMTESFAESVSRLSDWAKRWLYVGMLVLLKRWGQSLVDL
jgi:intracellular sulfur oxidation DsrE/DsrF family protein